MISAARGRNGCDALPLLVGISTRLGNECAVDLSGGQQPDQQRADRPAVLRVVDFRTRPDRIGIDDRTEALCGRAAADLPIRVRRVGTDLGGLYLGLFSGSLRPRAATMPRSEARRGAEVPAQRTAGAHLDQLRQIRVLVHADGIRGQTATHVPHWMQRSAWITPASSSQNQTLPGGSVIPFICSLMR